MIHSRDIGTTELTATVVIPLPDWLKERLAAYENLRDALLNEQGVVAWSDEIEDALAALDRLDQKEKP